MINMQNPVSIMAAAGKLSVAQLQQAIKDGTIPPYIGIPLLQEKTKQAKQLQQAAMAQQPTQQPIAAQVMAEAHGVDGLSSGIGEHAYKGGGIVAFSGETDGSYVGGDKVDFKKYYADPARFSHVGVSPDDEAYDAALASSSVGNAGINALKWLVPGYIPYRSGKWLWNQRVTGVDPKTGKLLHGYDNQYAPVDDTEAQRSAFAKQQSERQAAQALDNAKPDATPEKPNQQIIDLVNPAKKDDKADTDKADQDIELKQRAYTGVGGPATNFDSLKWKGIKDRSAAYDELERLNPTKSAKEHMDELRNLIGTDSGMQAVKDKLAAMETKAGEEERRAPWEALMQAGLATMAGTSPYALTNIGAGGQKGLEAYTQAKKDLQAGEEKRFAIQSQIASAEHAEQVAMAKHGVDSHQADMARMEQRRLQKLGYQNQLEMANAEGEFKAAQAQVSAQQTEKQLNIIASHYTDEYNAAIYKTKKELQGIEKYNIGQQTALVNNGLTQAEKDLQEAIKSGTKAEIAAAKGNVDYYRQLSNLLLKKSGFDVPEITAAAPVGGGAVTHSGQKIGGENLFVYSPNKK